MKKQYKTNESWWDERANIHKNSDYYNLKKFNSGELRLRPFEVKELGNIKGKSLIHLQCHLGTETLSLAKLGAKVVGVDFSQEAIKVATENAKIQKVDAKFIHSNVYNLFDKIDKKFDIVYVSVGSLHWLDDIEKWAQIVFNLLNKNGVLYIYEFHPVSNVLSEQRPEFVRDYFLTEQVVWDEVGSYTDYSDKTEKTTSTLFGTGPCLT